MPTTLARIQVTRTPEIERALELAAKQWPDAPLSELLSRLALAGAAEIESGRQARREARRAALRATQGTVYYPPGYLEELRKDWPE